VRVVVDSRARIPLEASILHKGNGLRIVAVSEKADPEKIAALKHAATVIVAGEKQVNLAALMDELGTMGIQRIMVEGGGELIAGMIRARLVDEIYTFIGNLLIGGRNAPTLVDGEGFLNADEFPVLSLLESRRIENGILLHWKVEHPKAP
jgi:2,5-diamino-6-(ribosylamino)-4(3H)-pyrimidinone 5'-phosphate reductase